MAKRSQEVEEQANFIFRGTIRKLKAATMPEVPVDKRTAIVKVAEVIVGPPDLTAFLGQEITVELSSDRIPRPGQQLIFHTAGWIYGASVAVRSLREEQVKGSASASRALGTAARHGVRAVQPAHFADADLVVAGKVVNVRIPEESTPSRRRSPAIPSPITEHDPVWREAVIQVSDVLKGEGKTKRVTVRFPDSSDVMFHGVPRFEPGQEGYFMLHKGEATSSSAARTRLGKSPAARRKSVTESRDTYFALDAQDFQPFEK